MMTLESLFWYCNAVWETVDKLQHAPMLPGDSPGLLMNISFVEKSDEQLTLVRFTTLASSSRSRSARHLLSALAELTLVLQQDMNSLLEADGSSGEFLLTLGLRGWPGDRYGR